jgi:hypothetical protein
MAAIAALRMHHLFNDTEASVGGVWLFGAPRTGNAVWQRAYAPLLERTLRFSNAADFASRLPAQSQFCTSRRLGHHFEFAHVGQSVLLCPDTASGLVRWRLAPNGSETLDCSRERPDVPDITVTTHWLGSYFDAWRRGYALRSKEGPASLATDPHIAAVNCDECSLSYPTDRAKQLNVPARSAGPIACSTPASCSSEAAWQVVAAAGDVVLRKWNASSTCAGYICT